MTRSSTSASATMSPIEQIRAASRGTVCLAVFLRHAGCPFLSRELDRIAAARAELEALPVRLILVTLWNSDGAPERFAQRGLADVLRVSDPDRKSHRWAGLRRARLWDVAGPRVWWPALRAMASGHLPRVPRGDIRQLPGLALVRDGHILARHVSGTSYDLPEPVAFCRRHLPETPSADSERLG